MAHRPVRVKEASYCGGNIGFHIKEYKPGLSWAELSQSPNFGLIKIYLNRVEFSLSKCLNVFLKLTHHDLKLCL